MELHFQHHFLKRGFGSSAVRAWLTIRKQVHLAFPSQLLRRLDTVFRVSPQTGLFGEKGRQHDNISSWSGERSETT
jgi:hypothetical protein